MLQKLMYKNYVEDAILVEYIFIPDFPRSYVLELVTELLRNGLVFFCFETKKNKKKETNSSDGFFFNRNPVVFIFFILLKIYFEPKSVHAEEH